LYFSIITPTFNSSRYIIKNIDSLNKQKFINFEQIIIDNLSTDKTLEIIKKKANYKIRIFSKKDKGIYNAMNKGSVLARGKFLLFLNSDDWLEKNSLELVANTILKNSNYTVYYGDSNFYNKKSFQFKHNSNIDEILKTNSISHQATYYKKDIFRKYKYNEKYKVGADYDFTIKLIKDKYKFFYINSILSNNSLGGYSSNLHQSFNDFYKIQLKNNGALTAYKNIILEYHYKLICVFIKKLCKII
jgi:glycosyltransferase involved in cell wall biosynthesis